MKIYTKTGDLGETSLVGGNRVCKSDVRVEAYGTCDEANSMIGFALSLIKCESWTGKDEFMERLFHVQETLFHVGAELSTPKGEEVAWPVKQEHIDTLERQIDEWNEKLPPLKNFLLPYGNKPSSALHVARTAVRRVERLVIPLKDHLANELVIPYLNRLSDFLFVAARFINYELNGEERGFFPNE